MGAVYQRGRAGTSWNAARKQVLANAEVCAICGGHLDFNARPRTPQSPSVDHLIPLSVLERDYPPVEAMRMATDVSMLRAVHYGCNSRRGDKTFKRQPHFRPVTTY